MFYRLIATLMLMTNARIVAPHFGCFPIQTVEWRPNSARAVSRCGACRCCRFDTKTANRDNSDRLLEMAGEIGSPGSRIDDLVDRRVRQTEFGTLAQLIALAERNDPVQRAGERGWVVFQAKKDP